MTIIGKDNFNNFKKEIKKLAENLKDKELVPTLEVDAEVNLTDLDWELIDELNKFEPFAEANPTPLFKIKNVVVESVEVMGKKSNHARFYLSQSGKSRKAISFFTPEEWLEIKPGAKVDVVVEFGINEWNGNRELQFKIIDIKIKE
jgi:single-stranded-DNA-specific exonuclease